MEEGGGPWRKGASPRTWSWDALGSHTGMGSWRPTSGAPDAPWSQDGWGLPYLAFYLWEEREVTKNPKTKKRKNPTSVSLWKPETLSFPARNIACSQACPWAASSGSIPVRLENEAFYLRHVAGVRQHRERGCFKSGCKQALQTSDAYEGVLSVCLALYYAPGRYGWEPYPSVGWEASWSRKKLWWCQVPWQGLS